MIAGTSAGVAYLNKNRDWTVFPGTREFGSITSVLPDAQGSIDAVVAREGVIQLAPDGSLAARTSPGEGTAALTLVRTTDGQVLLAGGGIYCVQKKGSSLMLDPEDLPGDRSSGTAIAIDGRTGDLWACSAEGLLHKESGKWRKIAQPVLGPCVSLAIQANGDVWAVQPGLNVAHPGLAMPDKVRWFGLFGGFALGFDTRGWVWRGKGDGVFVAESTQARNDVWLHLNEVDGLTDLDVNRRSFFSDSDGSVWWAADTSIVHFSPPPDLVRPAAPPPIFLSAFTVNGATPKLAETFRDFPHGSKLTAQIGSLQFQARNAVRIRYRLLPEQKEWRDSPSLELELGSPAWGTHTLELRSGFSMGPWSGTYSRPITVLRPWWISWQALLGFVGVGVGGSAGGMAWRRIQRANAKKLLPDLTGWRMAALSPESQWVGTTLDLRYQIVSLVARGGFAAVLKGRDLSQDGRPCAVKIFRHEVIHQDWLNHRFQQEVSAMEQIRHPSVVSIYGHGLTPSGAPYLVMEFIDGDTLREVLDAGPLAPRRAASFLRQAAGALEQIHARGIYHRDLKPENLMIRSGRHSGEELVLIDFSIAIVKEPDQTIHGLSRAAGTIYYMAPEQAVGFALPASDIYSLAKILLEMLTGQRLSALLPDAAMDLPDRVRELARGLPVRLSEQSVNLLAAALEFDPLRRPAEAGLFAEPIARDLSLSED
jgi:tRNA A-37 threonylcarbamoyl transferase component Bud32